MSNDDEWAQALGEQHVVVVTSPWRANLLRVPVADLRVLTEATDQIVLVVDS